MFISRKWGALSVAMVAAMGLSQQALAESTYGYNAAGTGPVTANARLDIEVRVPLLILLRVGSSGAGIDNVVLQAGVSAIPGGVPTLAGGNNQATGWDGAAPAVGLTSTPANVQAWAWTNAAGGGSLDAAAILTAGATSTGVTLADINVAATTVSGGGLSHPGTNLGSLAAVNFARNVVQSSMWEFSMLPATLSTLAPGTDALQVIYTASTL